MFVVYPEFLNRYEILYCQQFFYLAFFVTKMDEFL